MRKISHDESGRNFENDMRKLIFFIFILLPIYVFFTGARTKPAIPQSHAPAALINSSPVDYQKDIKPILDSRCVVCHSCYDAPCQLQLGSQEGISRGAHKEKVYNTTRLFAAEPTRLFMDAQTDKQWKQKGFFPVTDQAKEEGLISKMLALKQEQTFPDQGMLDKDRFDFSLDRAQHCPSNNEFEDFAKEHPEWGMPYGLPALSSRERQTLLDWLKSGAKPSSPRPTSPAALESIAYWESFLNQNGLKNQLMSRYLFEHWFQAHIYFEASAVPEYFEWVRSKTPPGKPIELIATRRAYDDPGVERVYYRLRPVQSSLLAKTHVPFKLDQKRMNQLKAWFLNETFQVTHLPSYEPKIASNPFKAFEQLPIDARYRLLLDEAQFTIMGFIKGPVCHGQAAVNVINDHFWILFADPDLPSTQKTAQFLVDKLKDMSLPIELESNAHLLGWLTYSRQEKDYLQTKSESMANPVEQGLSAIWDGNKTNPNAALTVLRHFDNATVVKGLVGESPQAAWVLDYPLLERIHYLLVAGFDVYGNMPHQVQSRLYMDFLRMEAEFNFLNLLPKSERKPVLDSWYRDVPFDVKDFLDTNKAFFNQETRVEFKSEPALEELWSLLKEHLASVSKETKLPTAYAESLKKISNVKGIPASLMPETSFLTLKDENNHAQYFSVLRNSAHTNISGMAEIMLEEKRRLPEEDSLLITTGFLGAYPNAFFEMPTHKLPDFVKALESLKSEEDYAQLLNQYGIRRTHPNFWPHSDALHRAYQQTAPLEAGLFDYSRFENR